MLKKIFNFYTEGFPPRKDSPPGYKGLIKHIVATLESDPVGLDRILILQPIFAIIISIVCLFLLRKGHGHAPIAITLFIFAFFYLGFRLYLQNEKSKLIYKVWDMALLVALNDMLFFVIPFYFESMTFFSRNMLFAPVLIGLGAVANWFFLYDRLVLKSPTGGAVFYALTFFCVLNFIFPIIFGMRNIWSLLLSECVAALTVTLYIYPHMNILKNFRNTMQFICSVAAIMAFLFFGRSFIPPSPLKLMMATACENIEKHLPVKPYMMRSVKDLERIYFYSSIFAPRGLAEKIDHVWFFEGKKLFTVSLSEIKGGYDYGFGTWSWHKAMEGPGKYRVEVWTSGGQLLGEKSFVLTAY